MQREVPGALVLYPSGEPSGAHAPPGIRTADFVLDKDFFLIEGHPCSWLGKKEQRQERSGKNNPRSFTAFRMTPHWVVGSAILFTGFHVFSPIRFLWNATRGSRLAPWRSKYLRWRLETYSGMWAEKMKVGEIFSFIWAQRWEFLSFLLWTGRVQREARRRP